MEQKQRRVKANPFGEQEEEEGLPSPPEIDDVLKAAEMAQEEQRNRAKQGANPTDLKPQEVDKICMCGDPMCWRGPFVYRVRQP